MFAIKVNEKENITVKAIISELEEGYIELSENQYNLSNYYRKFNRKTKEFYDAIQTDQLALLKQEKITKSKELLASWLESHPLNSKVHKDTGELYTITEEKQSLLTQNLMLAQLTQSQTTTWNCQGGICEEWQTVELVQLAMEIEAYVRPRIKKQQSYEVQINSCNTVEGVNMIEIEYDTI